MASINFCHFSHIYKQGNCVAHNFCRHASDLLVWMEDVSPHINSILLADFDQFVLIESIFFSTKKESQVLSINQISYQTGHLY